MGKFAFLYFLVSCIGLSSAFFPSVDLPERKPSNGTCIIQPTLVLKSLKSSKFVNGKNTVNMVWSIKTSFYKFWVADAGMGWFTLRSKRNGMKLLDVEGGCKNAKPGSKLGVWPKDEPEDNNKFVFNSDGSIQSLCRKDLYLKVSGKSLILDHDDNPSTSPGDVKFIFRPW